MIIVNGTIEYKAKDGGGIGPTTGYPITATSEWCDPIPCQYVPTEDRQARSAGEAMTRRHFAIFLEDYQRCTICANEQIRLRNECGCVIGEFSVISVTPLLAVDETRIDV
jgi:hypothetical protein